MKLIELLTEDEMTIYDEDYDIEFYMEKLEVNDNYDRAMMKLAKLLEVDEDDALYGECTCNVSELLESNLKDDRFKALFLDPDIDYVMEDIESIMAGYCSDKWYKKFGDLLHDIG